MMYDHFKALLCSFAFFWSLFSIIQEQICSFKVKTLHVCLDCLDLQLFSSFLLIALLRRSLSLFVYFRCFSKGWLQQKNSLILSTQLTQRMDMLDRLRPSRLYVMLFMQIMYTIQVFLYIGEMVLLVRPHRSFNRHAIFCKLQLTPGNFVK